MKRERSVVRKIGTKTGTTVIKLQRPVAQLTIRPRNFRPATTAKLKIMEEGRNKTSADE